MPTMGCGHWNGRRNRLPHLAGSIVWRVGGAGGFACRWKLISIAHPNPENGYAPPQEVCPSRRNRPAFTFVPAAALLVDQLVLLQVSLDRFHRRQFSRAVRAQ